MENGGYRVEMDHVEKSFGGVCALGDARLQVRPGEIHALVGENGAGKSTLMKILAGALERDAGTVKIEGREMEKRQALRPSTRNLCLPRI